MNNTVSPDKVFKDESKGINVDDLKAAIEEYETRTDEEAAKEEEGGLLTIPLLINELLKIQKKNPNKKYFIFGLSSDDFILNAYKSQELSPYKKDRMIDVVVLE